MGKSGQGYRPPGRTAEAAKTKAKVRGSSRILLAEGAFNQTGSFSALLWLWVARSGTDTYVYFSACQSTQNICHCCPSPESIHHLSVSRPRIALTHQFCYAHVSLSRLVSFGLLHLFCPRTIGTPLLGQSRE
ncbi:hypothetical protein ASPBRDRAFT_52161 [Aspergillus brasiliensis CBS 101740]|uniref:Uncharacterized protein n=1 Tax=Aspergillus brasiliensis (strain CBS 101740 / IMI 381727 / IBT 21946) TaxID=767769 RepID=A0A1L9UY53_ASPBC|nr:hypothetical protein ASPBRDRAFT_52161 [Aspergillus brasiliensis CBS 101740]